MARINRSVAPYYDDYTSSKQYTHMLAIPGRVAQAREITQIQSTVKDIIKSIGDSIMKDGDVIEGCQVIINSSKDSATITPGRVYIGGMVLPVPETTIAIRGTGSETIGFKLNEILITENEDNTLRDPAQGYDNFNQPGCHRIKSEVTIVKDDLDAAALVSLIDGEIAVENYAPNYDTMTQTLARRTYDESGSYIVNGLKVRVEENLDDSSLFNIVVESGKAYVLGYELRIPAARRISMKRALTHDTVSDYALTFSEGKTDYVLSSAPYISSITEISGYRSLTQNLAAPPTNSAKTQLAESAVYTEDYYSIEGYTAKVDYRLIREGNVGYIEWLGTSNYPTTSYNLTYRYTHIFENGKDYELTHNTSTDAHEISWISDTTPIVNTTFYVTYEQYLARKDVVYMDHYGNISVIEGTPAQYGFEAMPTSPVNTLALAVVMSPPNGDTSRNPNLNILVSNIGLTRFTMNDIQKLLNRLRTIEYDQAVISLNDEAREYNTTSDKRGIFTDPLIDMSKIDRTYNLLEGIAANSGLPIYSATIDTLNAMSYLPLRGDVYDVSYNESSTTRRYLDGASISLAKTGERIVHSQMNATRTFLVNPYSQFPMTPEISISPAVDNWISKEWLEEIRTTEQGEPTYQQLNDQITEIDNTTGLWLPDPVETNRKTVETPSGTTLSISERTKDEQKVREEKQTFIRRREIEVSGSKFYPGLDNIKCKFDGVSVELTPIGSTQAGSDQGTVKADNSGRFTAKFMIPENIMSGTREVKIYSDIRNPGYESSAVTHYYAEWIIEYWQKTIVELTSVLMFRYEEVEITHYIDPVGQSFVLDKDTILSGIDLYFATKPDDNTPIECGIREVVNGNIATATNRYPVKTLSASEVSVSSDGEIATRFNFDSPIYLESNKEYAFVVKSTSPSYSLWIAELGENDIISGNMVLRNPDEFGVMFSSSNNSSWTVHQTSDIKFRLIEDTYTNSSELYLNKITPTVEFNRILLNTIAATPDGTAVNWYYSTDSGRNYYPISPNNLLFKREMHESVIFKAILSRKPDSTLSPILRLDNITTRLTSFEKAGYYISKPIRGLDDYSNVDIVLDTNIPANTKLEVYISTAPSDNTDSLIKAELDEKQTPMNYNWVEKTYKVKLPDGEVANNCRIFIKMDSDYNYLTPSFRRLRAIMS